ncbi:hypothetical protein PC41400_14820 [Paenibacillus chitinolyticus]|uniref:Uncharacterized protein n=1 Tax=Paenibacillus chitinolyticus TaxID=79263 RepID=A0A410WX70_9BACL|nr:hypothetical protein [Paenibacillus chitinolyticus]MCY9592385.1 hypothetical protein [Paenibacillus chitinolyticus]MCY9599846.1 hypothetical protein [Paenibacillus chitinolyticus]QAV18882.1 hypothetical protein PC41400_14820 [Paenibacillus chitinolyticus]
MKNVKMRKKSVNKRSMTFWDKIINDQEEDRNEIVDRINSLSYDDAEEQVEELIFEIDDFISTYESDYHSFMREYENVLEISLDNLKLKRLTLITKKELGIDVVLLLKYLNNWYEKNKNDGWLFPYITPYGYWNDKTITSIDNNEYGSNGKTHLHNCINWGKRLEDELNNFIITNKSLESDSETNRFMVDLVEECVLPIVITKNKQLNSVLTRSPKLC